MVRLRHNGLNMKRLFCSLILLAMSCPLGLVRVSESTRVRVPEEPGTGNWGQTERSRLFYKWNLVNVPSVPGFTVDKIAITLIDITKVESMPRRLGLSPLQRNAAP